MRVLRVLVVHGGNAHPLQLVQHGSNNNKRAEFLKSRPRFDQSYFDGQRDPAEGWMSAWNAWRYPTFYTGSTTALPNFTFQPTHTLFIDAALQAQNDADLIQAGDRTNYEHIVDTVTHQPLSKQAALKGDDGIFYWDLSAKPRQEGELPRMHLQRIPQCTPQHAAAARDNSNQTLVLVCSYWSGAGYRGRRG